MMPLLAKLERSAMAMPFRPVDIDSQARKQRLEERAREDGAHEYPPTDSVVEANAEMSVRSAIMAERDRCLLDLLAHLRAYRDALARLQTAMDVAGMRQAADEAEIALTTLHADQGNDLASKRVRAASAQHEYDEFRAKNKLTRLARQPTARGQTISLAIFFVVVEAICNAFFFAASQEYGLFGGAVMAAAFSVTNIIIGILNGWFPTRWARHRNWAIRLSGWASCSALAALSLFLNLFVAHYRDLAEFTAEQPPLPLVLHSIISDPVGLHSIQSWLLLLIGVLFAGFVVYEGHRLDDPYPGYGAVDRRREYARGDFEELRRGLIAQAEEILQEFNNELRTAIETLRASSAQREQILAARTRIVAEFEAHESHLAQAGGQLLSRYRRANELVRRSRPPQHFHAGFSFPDRASERPAVRDQIGAEDGLQVNAEGLIAELDKLRVRVMAVFAGLATHQWEADACL